MLQKGHTLLYFFMQINKVLKTIGKYLLFSGE